MALACLALAHSSQAQTAKVSASFSMPTRVQAVVTTMDCENHPGPTITLEGGLILGGLNVDFIFRNNINKDVHVRTESVTVNASLIPKDSQFIFRNNDNPVGGPHEAIVKSDAIVLIPPDVSITFPKQPVRGGVGGNPWISVQFRNGDGTAIGGEVLLGRCEQLSKQ